MAAKKATSKRAPAKKTANVGGEAPAPRARAAAPAKPGKDHTLAHVSVNGERVRTYSVEDHGEGFADLANEFASKEEGRKVEFE